MAEAVLKHSLYLLSFGMSFRSNCLAWVSAESPARAYSLLENHIVEDSKDDDIPRDREDLRSYFHELEVYDTGVKVDEEKVVFSDHSRGRDTLENYFGKKLDVKKEDIESE